MSPETIFGLKIAAVSFPAVGKATVLVLTNSMGVGVLIGLALASVAGGFYVCRKISGSAQSIARSS
jgi:hypothetical protein